jgi:2,5-diketo-D-gluconate reductase A
LTKLRTEYVDLYLVHHALSGPQYRLEQWRALCDLKKQGLCRHIGVSNWSKAHIEEVKAAGLDIPEVNQIEIHPLCAQRELVAYCIANGIIPVAYSSLAPASTWRTEPGQASSKEAHHCTAETPLGKLIHGELVQKYNVSESQILLKWALQHGYPILPKSSKRERIIANTDLFGFEISASDMARLDALDENMPFAWPGMNPLECP